MTRIKTKGLLTLAFTLVLAVAALGMFSWSTSAKAANSETAGYQKVEIDFMVGTCGVKGGIQANNVNWSKTDKLNMNLYAASGTNGARIRFKVRHYWGNSTILPGNEVIIDEVTLGTNGYSWELWCDHGGKPSGTGTSNQRWNCNFSVVWLQAKCGNEMKEYRFILNYDDGGKDSFNDLETSSLDQYRYNFSAWDTAW